jgi:hypothetical protein
MAKDNIPLDMTPLFPRELLEKPRRERVNFFREKIIGHPNIKSVREEILCAVEDSAPGSIIICTGPAGVGKTTVMEDVKKAITKLRRVELERDPGRLAVASLRLKSPQTGNFDFKKHFFKPLLVSMEEPLVDKKIDMSPWAPHHRENIRLIASKRAEGEEYRDAVEEAILHRKPTAILVDDAQHFGVLASGRKLIDQTNTLKSFVDRTGVILVLFCTYEFLNLRNQNGQVSRRSTDIHFRRYRATIKAELDYFISAFSVQDKK